MKRKWHPQLHGLPKATHMNRYLKADLLHHFAQIAMRRKHLNYQSTKLIQLNKLNTVRLQNGFTN